MSGMRGHALHRATGARPLPTSLNERGNGRSGRYSAESCSPFFHSARCAGSGRWHGAMPTHASHAAHVNDPAVLDVYPLVPSIRSTRTASGRRSCPRPLNKETRDPYEVVGAVNAAEQIREIRVIAFQIRVRSGSYGAFPITMAGHETTGSLRDSCISAPTLFQSVPIEGLSACK